MKKFLTLVILMMILISLSPTRAQIFPDCDLSGNYSNTTSGWHPTPYSMLRYSACITVVLCAPGDTIGIAGTAVCYVGFPAYTLTFPVTRTVTMAVVNGSDTVWSNIPTIEPPDTHTVTWGFGGGVEYEMILDSTAHWAPGEYELHFSLTALPEFVLALDFTVDSPVPVELMAFTAELVDQSGRQDVLLEWTTATEINNYGWHIERYDEMGWQRIAWQGGAGNSNSPKAYSYLDRAAQGLAIQYRLLQIDLDGTREFSPLVGILRTVEGFTLDQNYPNPFNPSTNISYSLPTEGHVKLRVYNMLGQEIKILVNAEQPPGVYTVTFNADNLPSGMYIYQLRIGEYAERKKMTLLK